MSGASSLRFTTQTQIDIRRMTRELTDLQRQIASGYKADDLAGFGGSSSRLLSAQGLKDSAEARASVLNQLDARLGLQSAAIGQVANATGQLSQAIRQAVSADDGRGVAVDLENAFAQIVAALNETWNGQPLFAGERQEGRPIKVDTLDELALAVSPTDIFDEALRRQTVDLDSGSLISLAPKASEIGTDLLNTLRDLKLMLDNPATALGPPIGGDEFTQLMTFVSRLEGAAGALRNEEGRSGQLQARFDDERTRLVARADLITKEIGEHADADLAQVSIRLNALMVQYQAAAKTFSDLSRLTLLNYL